MSRLRIVGRGIGRPIAPRWIPQDRGEVLLVLGTVSSIWIIVMDYTEEKLEEFWKQRLRLLVHQMGSGAFFPVIMKCCKRFVTNSAINPSRRPIEPSHS